MGGGGSQGSLSLKNTGVWCNQSAACRNDWVWSWKGRQERGASLLSEGLYQEKKKKGESEDGCGPISPPGFWIINKDKEDDYQVLTLYFVWISFCLWRGSEALAIQALWRPSCWEGRGGCLGHQWRSHGMREASGSCQGPADHSQRRQSCTGKLVYIKHLH